MRERSFSPERALESILFLSNRLQTPQIHEVLKLRYFADKLHMSRFGFPASGDSYSAMEFGPVASETYNILKAARGERNRWIADYYHDLVRDVLVVVNKDVTPLRDARLELLSRADVQCLEEAIERWGGMTFKQRTKLSHDDAYSAAWAQAVERGSDAFEMPMLSIAETLENGKDVAEYLKS